VATQPHGNILRVHPDRVGTEWIVITEDDVQKLTSEARHAVTAVRHWPSGILITEPFQEAKIREWIDGEPRFKGVFEWFKVPGELIRTGP
jgi:hypothetical protein